MKGTVLFVLCLALCVVLTSCMRAAEETAREPAAEAAGAAEELREALSSGESALLSLSSSTSIFNSLTTQSNETTLAELDIYLNETEAAFLVVSLPKAVETTMRYTYSTQDKNGVELGFYSTDKAGERTEYQLERATEAAYGGIWVEEMISLPKGETAFYLTGDDQTCKMRFELGLRNEQLTYVGMSPEADLPEEIREKLVK